MDEVILHPVTRKLLDAYRKTPSHAILLDGEEGVGLGTIASRLAHELTQPASYITTIAPEKGNISIDRIRRLYEQTRAQQDARRVIIIDDAESMSVDAQNSLLKLLEEPTDRVHFILTSHHPALILSTIRSRSPALHVQRVDQASSESFLKHTSLDEKARTQALFLANGLPAELARLADDETYFAERTQLITDARSFLQADAYSRLTLIKKYTDRASAIGFLEMCAKLLNFTIFRQKDARLADTMLVIDEVMTRLQANTHVRTQLMYLVTKLS